MSWYFLGGFSAYFKLPSGRRLNHSGCPGSHGWSPEAGVAEARRGLDGEVTAQLHPVRGAGRDERVEVLEGAEVAVQRVVTARLVADRVRDAGVVGRRHERVVAALAVRVADRVDRRHVEHVEAELGQARHDLGGP